MASEKILAVDDNAVNLKVVSAALIHAGYEVITAQSGPEALAMIEKSLPDVVLLDISMPEMDGYEVCRRLRANPRTAQLPIMMLTAHDSLEEKVKGFEVGADDYLTKPFQPAELQARVKVLLKRKPAVAAVDQDHQSRVIGVYSLRGGVGVSTLASNLAAGLISLWNKPVCLVDMAFCSGQSAVMFNLPLRNTWTDLARLPVEELDADVVDAALLKHDCGLSVLAAPRKAEESELITTPLVLRTLELLKTTNAYLVLDLPHNIFETTITGLDYCDEILLVMAPEIASVRAAAMTLDLFDGLKYDRSNVKLILNWTFERRGLARKDIEKVLKQPVYLVLPFASDIFISALNLGAPPVLTEPESPLGALFEDFAFALSSPDHRKRRPANPSAAYQRVAARIASRQPSK